MTVESLGPDCRGCRTVSVIGARGRLRNRAAACHQHQDNDERKVRIMSYHD